MHLGKTLDDWKEGRVLVLQELLQNCNLDDEKAAVYLEAATSWDFLALLKFIDDGTYTAIQIFWAVIFGFYCSKFPAFETVKREAYGESPPKKREKKSRLPSDAFNRVSFPFPFELFF